MVNEWENYVNIARIIAVRTGENLLVYKADDGTFHIRRVIEFVDRHGLDVVQIDARGNATEIFEDGSTHATPFTQQPWREGRPALFRH